MAGPGFFFSCKSSWFIAPFEITADKWDKPKKNEKKRFGNKAGAMQRQERNVKTLDVNRLKSSDELRNSSIPLIMLLMLLDLCCSQSFPNSARATQRALTIRSCARLQQIPRWPHADLFSESTARKPSVSIKTTSKVWRCCWKRAVVFCWRLVAELKGGPSLISRALQKEINFNTKKRAVFPSMRNHPCETKKTTASLKATSDLKKRIIFPKHHGPMAIRSKKHFACFFQTLFSSKKPHISWQVHNLVRHNLCPWRLFS